MKDVNSFELNACTDILLNVSSINENSCNIKLKILTII
jgi:hypothetical protein